MHDARPRRPHGEPRAGDTLPLAGVCAEQLVEGGLTARVEPFEGGGRKWRRGIARGLANAGRTDSFWLFYSATSPRQVPPWPGHRPSIPWHAGQGS